VDRLRNMLADQLNVQAVIQPDAKPLNEMTDIEDRLEAIRYNYIALVQELSEAMNEVGWKSWATSRHINQEMFGELRDVFQFLVNLMFLATGDSPDQLADRLMKDLKAKHEVNIQRALSSYDGVSTKCPGCKRALDEVGLTIIHMPNDVEIDKVLCICGTQLTVEMVEPYLND
jgi:hypothetical protein